MTSVAIRPAANVPLLISLVLACLRLGGVGLAAIGISGVLAVAGGIAFGKDFVAGDQPGLTYTYDRCADFFEYHPGAPDCAAAATAHHFDEVISYRGAAGVLGLLALAAARFVPGNVARGPRPLPAGLSEAAGAAVFGVAGAGLLALGFGQLVMGSANGAGAWLSGGLIAAGAFAAYAVALMRVLSSSAD